MKILTVIPARGGSKRLPGKNIRPLGEKPLIHWSIDVVKGITVITDILVSTDDLDVAQIALKDGVLVPWLRPAELATDEASTVDVILHAVNWYESEFGKVTGVLVLQPTSPFRTKESIILGIKLFQENNFCPVIGVSPVRTHPMWCFSEKDGFMQPFLNGDGFNLRSQDLPDAYVVNGAFYLIKPEDLRENNSFFNSKMVPLFIRDNMESIDIDTEFDWMIAEASLSYNRGVLA